MLAEELAAALEPKAKENQKASGGDKITKNGKAVPSILTEPIDARAIAAKEANVSTGTMSAYNPGQLHQHW